MGGGIYGSFLSHFPELFQRTDAWELNEEKQRINIRRVSIILIDSIGSSIVRKKLIDEWIKDIKGNEAMFSYASTDINIGTFLLHPEREEVYRIEKRLAYSRQGGFKVWVVTKVQGEDSIRTEELEIKGAVF